MGFSQQHTQNDTWIKGDVVHINLGLFEGKITQRNNRKVIWSETMAWKRGVITWIQPQFGQIGCDN